MGDGGEGNGQTRLLAAGLETFVRAQASGGNLPRGVGRKTGGFWAGLFFFTGKSRWRELSPSLLFGVAPGKPLDLRCGHDAAQNLPTGIRARFGANGARKRHLHGIRANASVDLL
jgi:hypothetical protein